ncbi:MAG: hypothetical protein NT092_06865 [Bacteroidia bacterium]|nr:hypothetical protein [Bacteroidia bacterium]
MNRNRFVSILGCLVIFTVQAMAQAPFTDSEMGSEFIRGMELFNKEKYPAAIRFLDSYIENNNNSDVILLAEAKYYRSVAALHLFNPDA